MHRDSTNTTEQVGLLKAVPRRRKKSLEIYFRGKVINERTNSPGKRCMRTLTSLSSELKTKLQRQTISAHANGPCRHIRKSRQLTSELLPQKIKVN